MNCWTIDSCRKRHQLLTQQPTVIRHSGGAPPNYHSPQVLPSHLGCGQTESIVQHSFNYYQNGPRIIIFNVFPPFVRAFTNVKFPDPRLRKIQVIHANNNSGILKLKLKHMFSQDVKTEKRKGIQSDFWGQLWVTIQSLMKCVYNTTWTASFYDAKEWKEHIYHKLSTEECQKTYIPLKPIFPDRQGTPCK
jgi:hypothetical protein